jgi:hypothetical protein
VRKVSVDPLPASASLAAFRGAGSGGRTVLLVAASSGVRVSRDGGVHWASPAASEAPRGAPIVLYGDAFGGPVLVTTEGVFRTADGARFEAVPGGLRPADSAQLLADRGGDPLLEIKTADGFAYWDGQSWSAKKKAVLGGGIFLQGSAAQKPVGGWTNLQDVDGTLFWQKGKSRRAFTSPRNGLTLASAAQVSSGRVYLGTMGDGLFVFEP